MLRRMVSTTSFYLSPLFDSKGRQKIKHQPPKKRFLDLRDDYVAASIAECQKIRMCVEKKTTKSKSLRKKERGARKNTKCQRELEIF